MKMWMRGLMALVVLAGLSGCGGGGGGAPHDDTPAQTNTPPTAQKVTLSTYADTTISGRFDVSDAEDTYLKYYLVDAPKHGTVTIDENNPAFTYTPKQGFTGQDSFSYKAYDGEAYSPAATVVIAIASAPTSSSDTQAPTHPVLLSANTLSPTAMTLFWLPVQDDTVAPEQIRYEVHCDTTAGFTPSDATRKATVMGAAEADITGLQKSTTYFVKIQALDAAGNAAVSNEINITTPEAAATVKLNSHAKIAKANDLFLHNAEVHPDKIVVPKTSKTKLPEAGSIYFGDADDHSLRKVVSANESGDTIVIKTEKASLIDAVDTLSLKSQTLMIPEQKMPTARSAGRMGRLASGYTLNGTHTDTYQWPSNRLQVTQESTHLSTPPSLSFVRKLGKAVSDTDDGLTITAVQEKLIAYPERFNFIDILLTQTDGIKIGKFYIKSIEHDGEDISCSDGNMQCGFFRLETYDWHTSSAKGRLVIDHPSQSDISDKPYRVTLFAKQAEGAFSVDDEVEVPIDIYIVSANSDIDTSKKDKLDVGGLDASVSTNLSFTPMVSTEVEIKNMSLTYGKISVGGKLELDINAALKYEKEATIDKSFDLGSKKFTQIYMAGEIPVYQEITLSWAAEVKGSIRGAIEQNTNLTKIFQANFGMEYRQGEWTPLASKGGDTDLTASIKVGAGGELEVRLVPTINIRFYRAVSSEMSIEPWGKVTFGAHGKATLNTDFDSYDTMVQYGLDDLTADVGLDLNLYASLDVFDYNILRYPAKDCGASDGCTRTGYKNVLALQDTIFSLPELSVETDAPIVPEHNMTVRASVTDGVNNPFDDANIQWRIFPANGATITPDPDNPRQATVRFSTFDEYQVIFVGSSKRLGATFGRQYATMTLDARDTDGDGMADVWESENGFDPDDGTDGEADRDGDGFTNQQEYLALTDPRDKNDHPDGNPDTNDTTPPTITINGDNPATVTVGDSYTDAGASAHDSVDGDVAVRVIRNTVDTSTAGDYEVVYSAKDAAGNEANATRTVHVVSAQTDTTPPTITINGDNPATVTVGDSYTDAGASAHDSVDGDVAVRVIRNTVDTSTAGDYEVVYSAKDAAGNEANATRTIHVVSAANQSPTANAGADQQVESNATVTLDGSGSSDSDGQIVSYVWSEGGTQVGTGESVALDNVPDGVHTYTLTVTDDANATASDSVTVRVGSTVTTRLKKTGQTKIYDEGGTVRTHAEADSNASLRDDGYYQKGVTPSYSRANEVVTDNITGLQWQDNNDTANITKPWLTQENYDKCTGSNGQTQDTSKCTDTSGDTATTYCANLTLGGYSDWRLPTVQELQSIVVDGAYDPSIDTTAFVNYTTSYDYWSSTAHADYTGNAWIVYFYNGSTFGSNKSSGNCIRCVR